MSTADTILTLCEKKNVSPLLFSRRENFDVIRHLAGDYGSKGIGERGASRQRLINGVTLQWNPGTECKPVPRHLQLLLGTVLNIRLAWRYENGIESDVKALTHEIRSGSPWLLVQELLVNAFDAHVRAGRGGPISFSIQRLANGSETIEVSDDGIGIASVREVPGTLLVSSNQVAPGWDLQLEGGRGVGLMWSKFVTELHRGKLEFLKDIHPGQRTTVRATFPSGTLGISGCVQEPHKCALITGRPGVSSPRESLSEVLPGVNFDRHLYTEMTPLAIRTQLTGGVRAFFARTEGVALLVIENRDPTLSEGMVDISPALVKTHWDRLECAFSETFKPSQKGNFLMRTVSGTYVKFIHGANSFFDGSGLHLYYKLSGRRAHQFILDSTEIGISSRRPWNLPNFDLIPTLSDTQPLDILESLFVEVLDPHLRVRPGAVLARSTSGNLYLAIKESSRLKPRQAMDVRIHIPAAVLREVGLDSATQNIALFEQEHETGVRRVLASLTGDATNPLPDIYTVDLRLTPGAMHLFGLVGSLRHM